MGMNKIKIVDPPKEYDELVEAFAGINLSVSPSDLANNESPDLLNMILDSYGNLISRPGFDVITTESSALTGLDNYRKDDGDILMVGIGTDLYKLDDDGTTTKVNGAISLSGDPLNMFTMNNKFYVQDGDDYYSYNGTTFAKVVGTIPLVLINCTPAGEGTDFEPYNRLQAGFRVTFAVDGVNTTYVLPLTGLDATTVILLHNGVAKTENTHFTVNRTTGEIDTSGGSSPLGVMTLGDELDVTAYKTDTAAENLIRKCTIHHEFGQGSLNYLFVSGNPDYPHYDYRSYDMDPEFFPSTGDDKLGGKDQAIMGYSTFQDVQLIIKERSIYIRYMADVATATFYTKKLSDTYGALAGKSIQVVSDYPTFLDSHGVTSVVGIDTQSEKTTEMISQNVNKNIDPVGVSGILQADDLSVFTSIDYDNKYMLCDPSTGKVFVLDYVGKAWLIWDNIQSDKFVEKNGYLYFMNTADKTVCKMGFKADTDIMNDGGAAINSYWTSKMFNFGKPAYWKMVPVFAYSILPAKATSAILCYRTNQDSSWQCRDAKASSYFSYSGFTYSGMTYSGNSFPKAVMEKVKLKKINHAQFRISNNVLNESLGITNCTVRYSVTGMSK